MATAKQVSTYRKTQADIATLAERELKTFFQALDLEDAVGVRKALEVFLPELIKTYGDIGAVVARDFYDEIRSSANVRKSYRSVLGDQVPTEAIAANTRWAVTPLFQKVTDGAATLSNLSLVTDRAVKQVGRNTIHTNVVRDPSRVAYARVPTGPQTCAFCLVLASRGAVYGSAESAGENNDYHGMCDCVPTPVWEGDDLPEGYDPDGLNDLYSNAVSESDSNSLKGKDGVLATLRQQNGVA